MTLYPENKRQVLFIKSGIVLSAGALAIGSMTKNKPDMEINSNPATTEHNQFAKVGNVALVSYIRNSPSKSTEIQESIIFQPLLHQDKIATAANVTFSKNIYNSHKSQDSHNHPPYHHKHAAATHLSSLEKVQKYIYTYFVNKKLSAAQSAGIDGNFGQESMWNPNINGGVAQETLSRLGGLEALATKERKPVADLKVQLDYVWLELTNGPGAAVDERSTLKFLKTTSSPDAAALVFMQGYEAPAAWAANVTNRVSEARNIYNKFGNKS